MECLFGIAVLSSVSCGVCWCSLVLLMRRVIVDLVGATFSWFMLNQVCSVLSSFVVVLWQWGVVVCGSNCKVVCI